MRRGAVSCWPVCHSFRQPADQGRLGDLRRTPTAYTTRHLCRAFVVLIVTTPPDPFLVTSPGRAIEPWIHGPQGVNPARISGIGVIDDTIFICKRAHAGPLPVVCGHVSSRHGCELLLRSFAGLLPLAPLERTRPRRCLR